MSHPLHDYIAKQLADKVRGHRVVVWYDPRREFEPFVGALDATPRSRKLAEAADPRITAGLDEVTAGGVDFWMAQYTGSFFEVRASVELVIGGDDVEPTVLYVPGAERDRLGSILMELETAGTTWEPQLKQLARNVLLQKYTQGVVDEMLPFERKVSYEDLARAAEGDGGAEPPSILKAIFHDAGGNDALLPAWLAQDGRDAEIVDKGAVRELTKLIRARLGLELDADATVEKLRAQTVRYLLASEFRSDLRGDAPPSLDSVAKPPTKEAEHGVHAVVRRLRAEQPDAYTRLADRVEDELGLRNVSFPADSLGAIDTFRFEERVLLQHCGHLVAERRFHDARMIVAERAPSFWLQRDLPRKMQWEAAGLMAELGQIAQDVRSQLKSMSSDARAWVEAYTEPNGWFRLDLAQRQLETLVSSLDDEPDERPLAVVRRAYEDTCTAMAAGFTAALAKAGWSIPSSLHQTHVFSDVFTAQPRPTAYFLVDAMRFEMGVDLKGRLPERSEVSLRSAITALPSITPIGMAALLPGASSSFSVVDEGGKLGSRVDGAFLPDLQARRKFTASRIPNVVDITLDELLGLPQSKLNKKVAGAPVIVVRSQEIDHAGEAGYSAQARAVMDSVIDNIARALRRLATAGIEHAVISADHGHLFFATDRDDSMRTDAPGGKTVELHRRCWIGRGGQTPTGCIRVPASALGYDSDLDFVFPASSGVFRAGGDLAFHHGGPSLQELVIPVLTVRTKTVAAARSTSSPVTATGLPDAVTNRIFSVTLTHGEKQMMLGAGSIEVRPLLVAAGKQVGAVGMAVDAEFNRTTGCIKLAPDKPVTVAFLLTDETASSVRVVVQDPATDAELYRSPTDIPVRLGV